MQVASIESNLKNNDIYLQYGQSTSIVKSTPYSDTVDGCSLKLSYDSILNQKQMLTQKEIKEYNCNICNKNFISKYALNGHLNTHINIEYTCNICDCSFLHKDALIDHAKQLHKMRLNGKQNTIYGCEICTKKFTSKKKNNNIIHNLIVQLNYCHVLFAIKAILIKHLLMITIVKHIQIKI